MYVYIYVCVCIYIYIHTMECYAPIIKNKFESDLVRQMNLGPVIQSEVSHKEKDKYRILTHIHEI